MVAEAATAHLVMVLDWVVVRGCDDVASLGRGPAEMTPNWAQKPAWDPFCTQLWAATKGVLPWICYYGNGPQLSASYTSPRQYYHGNKRNPAGGNVCY